MIALYPAAEVARALAMPGGEAPEELHVTLCYLGKKGAYPEGALANLPGRIAEITARYAPIEGTLSGWGCFSPSDRTGNKQVLWAGVELPAALSDLRNDLVTACAEAGAPVSDSTFVPHITLAYLAAGQKVPQPALELIPFSFDAVWFVSGPDRTRIPLALPAEAAQKMAREIDPPPVGVWDSVCIFGAYQHATVDGKPVETVWDASMCRFMLDDFATRKNDIFYDRRHEVVDLKNQDGEPLDLDELDQWARGTTGKYGDAEGDGRALAWADALVMVVGGQVVKYVRHSTAPENPPTVEELRRSDGSLPEDGVYGRRSAVTPLGADPKDGLPVYRYASPYFVRMRDGWRLLNLTATNDPRMEGVALAYERGVRVAMQRNMTRPTARSAMENSMDKPEKMDAPASAPMPEMAAMMAAAGCAETDAPDMKLAKMAAYARKMEQEAQGMRQMESSKMTEEPGDKKEMPGKEMADSKELAASKASRRMEEPSMMAESPDMQGLLSRMAALEEKNEMLTKELSESRSAMKSFRKMEEASKTQEAQKFARGAIAMGRIKGDHKGSVEETEKWLSGKYMKSSADAEDILSAEGTFQLSERIALQRYTSGGAGIGAPELGRAEVSLGDEVDSLIAGEIKAMQAAGNKSENLTSIAMERVSKKHPAAWARYAGRSA